MPGNITVGVPVFYSPTHLNRFHSMTGQATPLCELLLLLCCIIFIWHLCWTVLFAWLTKPNLLLENEWQASSISCVSRATLPWAVTQLGTEWETYMEKEMVKMNQGVVLFLLNQNCIDALYASATSQVMLSKSLRICGWKIRVLSFHSDIDTHDKWNCPIFVSTFHIS